MAGSREFVVPVERQRQIGVTYAVVEQRPLERTVHAAGTVADDPQRRWTFVARVDGYVQQLSCASVGQSVEKDQPLLSLYSPELLTTQRELVMRCLQMRDQTATAGTREIPSQLIAAAGGKIAAVECDARADMRN